MINRKIGCVDWEVVGEEIFFSATTPNIFCKVCKDDTELKVVSVRNKKMVSPYLSSSSIIKCNDKLFFSPFNCSELYVYDLVNSTMICIPLELKRNAECYIGNIGLQNFWTNYAYDGFVYFFGWHYSAIIKINATTLAVEYLTDWKNKIPKSSMDNLQKGNCFFGFGHILLGDNIYISSGVGSGIWKISKNVDTIEYIAIDSDIKGFHSIAEYNGNIILTAKFSEDDSVILWNPSEKNCVKIKLSEPGIWRTPVIYNNDIFLFPVTANSHVLKIDALTYECNIFNPLTDLINKVPNDRFLAVKQIGNVVHFIRYSDNCWFTYNIETNEINEKYYNLSENIYLEYKNEYYDYLLNDSKKTNKILMEENFPLEEFLKRV